MTYLAGICFRYNRDMLLLTVKFYSLVYVFTNSSASCATALFDTVLTDLLLSKEVNK